MNAYEHTFFLNFDLGMFIDFRQKGERNIDVTKKQPPVASHMHPTQGTNTQPRYVS